MVGIPFNSIEITCYSSGSCIWIITAAAVKKNWTQYTIYMIVDQKLFDIKLKNAI